MRRPLACVGALLLLAAAASCIDDDNPFGPIVGNVPPGVLGPSPLGAVLPIGIEVIATGLVSPVQLVHSPGSRSRRFIVDQVGLVRVLDADGTLRADPFLDLRGRIPPLAAAYDERGLLGLAFHPDYARNGRFYVFYTAPLRAGGPAGFNHTNVIAEFRATGSDPVTADAGSERIVLQVDHPQGNHNGGTIAFGPEGYLYISIGDGGGRDDEGLGHVNDWFADNAGGNAQDITQNLLGNILRIDVDGTQPYAIPPDNPFVAGPGLDEIWAYGFRNPYRFSFDMVSNRALLVGDAGQELWEEVSVVTRGGNYGWNVKEGTHCFDAENPTVVPATCPDTDPTTGAALESPVIEFANTKNGGLSLTVVGGHVYRGTRAPALRGMYVFGGATSSGAAPQGRLFAATPENEGLWTMHELLIGGTGPLNHVVKGFGQDREGEVYVTASEILGPTGTTGKVFRIVRPG